MIITPILVLIFLSVSIVKYKEIVNPISIVSGWWGLCLWLSNMSLTGIYIPGFTTQFFVISMLVGFTSGALLASRRKFNKFQSERLSAKVVQKYEKFFTISSIFLIPLSLYFAKRSIELTLAMKNPAAMRGLAFGDLIWGSTHMLLFYHLTVVPLIFIGCCSGPLLYFTRKKKKIFFLTIIFVVLYSSTMHSRGLLQILLVWTILSFYLSRKLAPLKKTKLRLKSYMAAVSFIILIVLTFNIISGARNTQNTYQTWSTQRVTHLFLSYYNNGFILFEQDLENPNSTLNTTHTLGFGSILGLLRLTEKTLRRIIPDFEYPWNLEKDHEVPRIIGKANVTVGNISVGNPIWSNAYFTFLYTFYKDFGYFGVVFIPMILGYITSKNYLNMRSNINCTFKYLFLLYIMVYGITSSALEDQGIWIVIIFLYLIDKKIYLSKARNKVEPRLSYK
jgi:oligosaccharide repeat unit polymerase